MRNFLYRTQQLFGVIALFGLLAAQTLDAAEWTLDRALESVRRDSPDAEIFRSRMEAAEALARQSQAAWLPHIQLEAGYQQTNQPMMGFGSILNTGTFDQTIDFNHPGQLDHFNASITVAYNLYSGGSPSAQREAAGAHRRAVEKDQEAAFEALSLAVVEAYYRVLQARSYLTAVEAAQATTERSLESAQARFEQGELLKNTVLDLEVRKSEIEHQRLGARHRLDLAERMFRVVLGFAPDHNLSVAEHPETLTPPQQAQRIRAEQLAMSERVAAANAAVDAQRGQRRPRVDAFASYQYDRGWRRSGDGDSWLAGLRMQWNVFDGQFTENRVRQSIAERSEVRAQERKLDLQLQLQLEEARLNHELAKNQLETTERMLAHAEESAAISRARFEAGDLLVTELLGAESRLTEARVKQTVARFNEQMAVAYWYRAAGLPLTASTFPTR